VEYVLTTTRQMSGPATEAMRDSITQALSGVTGQLQQLVPDARRFFDSILGSPIADAVGVGLLVLVVGLLLTRRD
jgi:hypothetical protein